MNKDYLYCINKDTCIHRKGCKRWMGNYTRDEEMEEANANTHGYVDDEDCIQGKIEELDVDGNPICAPYYLLHRFRLSNGEPMK